jgi:hypothetical protein
MKNVKVILLALSVLAGRVLVASAAATNAAPKTTYVLNANIALQSWANGQNKATRIDNKAVIQELNGTTILSTNTVITTNVPPQTNQVVVTNLAAFSKNAKLLIKKNLGATNEQFVVRDGTGKNTVDTDVSQFFTKTNTATAVFTPANGNSETDRSILILVFSPSGTSSNAGFNVSGFSQENKGKVPGTTGLQTKTLNATVAGTPGATPGTNATTVLTGKYSENGGHLE